MTDTVLDAPAAPPLIARLVDTPGARWVDLASLDDWLARPGDGVLFFAGDPVRCPECLDVAVVLPELQRAFPGRLHVGVARVQDEDALARRFGSQRWPALVFVRDGGYVTTVSGMLDWDDYLRRVDEALRLPVGRAPGVGIPVVAAGAAGSGCH